MINQIEKAALTKVMDKYRRQGYKVVLGPNPDELPTFLRDFNPDILATKDDEKIIVEIKIRSELSDSNDMLQLAKILEEKPGWKYELVFVQQDKRHRMDEFRLKELRTRDEVTSILTEAEGLSERGLQDLSILLAWLAAEATFRRIASDYNLALDEIRAAHLFKTVYSKGILSWKDFQFIQDVAKYRNEIAHGFRVKGVSKRISERFIKLVRKYAEHLEGSEF